MPAMDRILHAGEGCPGPAEGNFDGTLMTPQSKLQVAFEQLQRMHQALADLRANVLPRDPKLLKLMAEGTVAQIRDLQFQIDLESGVLAAQQAESDIWVKAEGVEVEWPRARSSVLTAVLDSLRKGIQNAAGHLIGAGAAGGRPLEALKQACDLEVFVLQPGSLMAGLKLPEVVDAREPVDSEKVKQAVEDYLRAAAWASSDEGIDTLDREFEDESYRKLLLAEVKRLAPRNSGSLEAVQLSGKRIAPSVDARLTRTTARRIREAIYRDTEHPPARLRGENPGDRFG